MADIWVWKFDGSKQCETENSAISLDDMKRQLAALIGDSEILGAQKRRVPLMLPQYCGAHTSSVNAYKITERGAEILFRGIVGPQGFELWLWPDPSVKAAAAAGGDVPFPFAVVSPAKLASHLTSVSMHPALIQDLIGHTCRAYKQGDALTDDWRPDRINIELTDTNTIAKIWFG